MTTNLSAVEKLLKIIHENSFLIIVIIYSHSSDIQTALIIGSFERAVTSFSDLAEMAKIIQGSTCRNLVNFVNDTVVFWYKILKEKLTGYVKF